MPSELRLDEVLAELSRLERETDDGPAGFTGQELAAKIGMSTNTAQDRLRKLVAAGKVEFVGRRKALSVSGVVCRIPVYRLVDKQDAAG